MKNPCKECIVLSMCSEDCPSLRYFICDEVKKYGVPNSLMKNLDRVEFFKNNTIKLSWNGREKGLKIIDGIVSTYKCNSIQESMNSTSFSWTRGD